MKKIINKKKRKETRKGAVRVIKNISTMLLFAVFCKIGELERNAY